MADLVGEAYIRLTVDTRAMDRAIKRAAKDAADDYVNEFGNRVESIADQKLAKAREELAQAIVDPKGFDQMAKKFKTVERAADSFRAQLNDLADQGYITNRNHLRSYIAAVDHWEVSALKAADAVKAQIKQQEELSAAQAAEEKRTSDRDKANKQLFKNWYSGLNSIVQASKEATKETERLAREQERLDKINNTARIKQRDATLKMMFSTWNNGLTQINKALAKNEKAVLDQDRAMRSYADNIRTAIERDAEPGFLRLSRRVDLFGDKVAVAGDRIGRVFGKGARNNFFNLFGRSIEFLISGPIRGLIEAFGKVGEAVGGLVMNFRLLREGGATVGKALAETLGGALKTAAPLLAMFAGGLLVILAAVPVLVSGVWLLVGALTAVVGAISVGIVGALAAAAPLVLGVIAGAGAIALAFERANEEGTKAHTAIEGLKDEWEDFKRTVSSGSDAIIVAIADVSGSLLDMFTPMVKGAQAAVTAVIEDFGKMMDDPQIQGFVKNLNESVPKALESVGKGINDLLGGLLGMFSALSPYTERLATGFENLMSDFNEWTQSAEGQNSIRDWMDTAFAAAEDLWDILTNVGSIIGKVFTSGTEGAGGDFLQYLSDVTEKFDTWLSSAEGEAAVTTFFEDVRDVMVTVKDALENIGTALDNFDTEEGRKTFQDLMDGFETGMQLIEDFSRYADMATAALKLFFGPVLFVKDALTDLWTALFGAGGALEQIGPTFDSIMGWFSDIGTWFSELPTKIGDAATAVGEWFAGIGESISGFLDGIITTALEWGNTLREALLTALLFIPALIVEIIGPETIQGWIDTFVGWYNTATEWLGTMWTLFTQGVTNIYNSVMQWITGIATSFWGWISPIIATITGVFSNAWNVVVVWATLIYTEVMRWITGIRDAIWGWISPIINTISTAFSDAYDAVVGWVTDLYNDVKSWITDLVADIGSWIGDVADTISQPFEDAYEAVKLVVDNIKSLFSGALERAASAAERINNLLPFGDDDPRKAAGGILYGPQRVVAGEAGREAIIPLDRPLSMVDASVRDWAAMIRGQGTPQMARGGIAGGKAVTVAPGAVVIQTSATDPGILLSVLSDSLADSLSTV